MAPVSLVTFRRLWRKYCPEIIVGKPKYDVCKFCHANFTTYQREAALDDGQKRELVQKMDDHLQVVEQERAYYNAVIAETKAAFALRTAPITPHIPLSYVGKGHHSFDMAQLVSIPHDPIQPGPIYFLTGNALNIIAVQLWTLISFFS